MTPILLHSVEKDGTGIERQGGLVPVRQWVYQGGHHTGRVRGARMLRMPGLTTERAIAGG